MSSSIERRRLLLGGAALGALPTTAFAQRGGDVLEIKTNETATIDGVVRLPSLFSRICSSPFFMTATAEFVVPRSIPIIFLAIFDPLFLTISSHYFSKID